MRSRRQAGVELATLALGEDPAKKGPHIGLGTKQLAALSRPMDLVDDPPGKSSRRFMLTFPGNREPASSGPQPSNRCR